MPTPRNSGVLRTIPLLIAVCFVSFDAQAQYGGGTGEPNDPYQIATAEDLMLLGETPEDYDRHFILTADIDLDPNLPGRMVFDKAVIGVGYYTPFTGVFDGNGHTISHLVIVGQRYLGLFGSLDTDAQLRNLGVVDANMTDAAHGSRHGILVGYNRGHVNNCYSTGALASGGGLVGENSGTLSDCHSNVEISGGGGGLAVINSGNVINCYSAGSVSAGGGGLVGYNGGSVINSHNTGDVFGEGDVGGLVGSNSGILSNCSNSGTIRNQASRQSGALTVFGVVGGLVGFNGPSSSIVNCYNTGAVSGESCVGGLVGMNDRGSIIGCHASGGVSSDNSHDVGGLVGDNRGNVCRCSSGGEVIAYLGSPMSYVGIGGLVGTNAGNVTNCYSHADVNEYPGNNLFGSGVGGLAGYNFGSVTNCYSTGAVSGYRAIVGGLIGDNEYDGAVIHSFWDMDSSGLTSSDGGTGLPTAAMQNIQTYLTAGWDFWDRIQNVVEGIWMMPEGGYPAFTSPLQLSGQGTDEDPYSISTATELRSILDPTASYKLTADIDLLNITWPDAVVPVFAGTFDGNSLNVGNLAISGTSRLGLFGTIISGAYVHDLGVVDVNIIGASYMGGLAGRNHGHITNCHSSGTVSGRSDVGGLVGRNEGYMINCSSTTTISCSRGGGLVGSNDGSVKQSCSIGSVSGDYLVGGLVGSNGRSGGISNSYSTGPVSSERVLGDVGGLVGNNEGDVAYCYSIGAVSSNGFWVGGLIGSGGLLDKAHSFWDIETSGQVASRGGMGKTTVEMQTASTFLDAGWDFIDETGNGTNDIWWILEGQDYPRLLWELPAGDTNDLTVDLTLYIVDETGDLIADANTTYADAGGILTYGICVSNQDASRALTDIRITDHLPGEVSFLEADGHDVLGRYDADAHQCVWMIPLLEAETTQCLILTVQVGEVAPLTIIRNQVTAGSSDTEAVSATLDIVVRPRPLNVNTVIAEGLAADPPAPGSLCASPGALITYSICVDNNDNRQHATDVLILDLLPEEVNFVKAEGDGLLGMYDGSAHAYTWMLPSLAGGDRRCLELVAQVRQEIAPRAVITNYITATSSLTPPSTASVAFTPCVGVSEASLLSELLSTGFLRP